MSEGDGKDKEPEVIDGIVMTGPSLVAQFEDETRQKWAIKADEEFGPFIVIVFDGEASAHFKQLRGRVSCWMIASVLKFFGLIVDLEGSENLMVQQKSKRRSGILTPGVQLPPEFSAGHKKNGG